MKQILKRLLKPVLVVSIGGVAVAAIGIAARSTPLYYAGLLLASPLYLVYVPLMIFAILAAFTWPIWVPFYRLAIKRHGAPFHPGDMVQVLRGQHKGEALRVYDVWNERDKVRLDIGDKEKKDVTDVFSFMSVKKIKESEPPPPYGSPAAGSPSGEA